MSAVIKRPESRETALHDNPGHLVRRLHQDMLASFTRAMGVHEISNVQFAALKGIAALQPTTQRAVADYIAMEPSNAHSLLRRLAARKLITIRSDRGDKRRSMISLSTAGETLLAELLPLEAQVGPELLEPLSAAERKTFMKLLRNLVMA